MHDDDEHEANRPDGDGMRPLYYCIVQGWQEGLALLLRHGAIINLGPRDNDTPLHVAARHGHVDIVKLLLEQPDIAIDAVAVPASVSGALVPGTTALIGAIRPWKGAHSKSVGGHAHIVAMLLAKGASTSEQAEGRTAREWARHLGHAECVQALKARRCAVCHATAAALGLEKLQKCGRCRAVYYCGAEHQKEHWSQHKPECGCGDDDG